MTQYVAQLGLFFHPNKRIDTTFDAPEISSDGGALLLRLLDDELGLSELLAGTIPDDRAPDRVRHSRLEQVRQRLYQLALGYEDCNDADTLRHDPVLKTVCDRLPNDAEGLSSQPTLSRLENAVTMRAIKQILLRLEQSYVQSLSKRRKFIVLDIDSTDDETHGHQQLSFFHGYYDQHMLCIRKTDLRPWVVGVASFGRAISARRPSVGFEIGPMGRRRWPWGTCVGLRWRTITSATLCSIASLRRLLRPRLATRSGGGARRRVAGR